MPYLPMYEAAYGLVAAISRVKKVALAPTSQQMQLLIVNLGLLRAGHKLSSKRLRSIALGEMQSETMRKNLHYQTLDRVLAQIFSGKDGI